MVKFDYKTMNPKIEIKLTETNAVKRQVEFQSKVMKTKGAVRFVFQGIKGYAYGPNGGRPSIFRMA